MTTAGHQARRSDPAHVLPLDLPPEFRQYDTQVSGIGAGQPGKVGLIELEAARRGGVTRIVHRFQQVPLHLFQPIYLDPARPDMPFMILLQQGGGLLQGDRYRIDITAREEAAIHVTSQSATKLYKCEENFTTQLVTIQAGPGSLVEYLPDITIPYRHARFFQRLDLQIDPEGTVIVGEVLAPGRVAHGGERHAYDIFFAQTRAWSPDGELLADDLVRLQPGEQALKGLALLGPYDAFGMLSVFSRRRPAVEVIAAMREALAGDAKVAQQTLVGVSELPNECGVAVRILGRTSTVVARARTVAWSAARMVLVGAPAPDLRKA